MARRTAALRGGFSLAIAVAVVTTAKAQDEPTSIQDNSFLLEEAYNQTPGVVQHINAFSRASDRSWTYTFTQEWPVGGMRHQLSYTVPIVRPTPGTTAGIGDVAANYRYQLVSDDHAGLFVAPRATLQFPTGRSAAGRGIGKVAAQFDLPVSYTPLPWLATHGNAGVTAWRGGAPVYNLGASAIWLVRPTFNVLIEHLWLLSNGGDAAFLSPGIRWAYNFRSGLQIVPGAAYTFGIGPSRGENSVFLYLSFEHPFKQTKP